MVISTSNYLRRTWPRSSYLSPPGRPGDALDKGFRNVAGREIEQFKRELAAPASIWRETISSVWGETSERLLTGVGHSKAAIPFSAKPGRRLSAQPGRPTAVADAQGR